MTTKKTKASGAMTKTSGATMNASHAAKTASHATMEEQIASLEAQIALLKEEGNRGKGIGDGKEANPPIPSPGEKADPPSGNDPATFLTTWLNEQQVMFDNFAEIVPQLGNTSLTPAERRRLLGSGVRRYGFIDKVSDTAEEFPQFWPASVHGTVDFQTAIKGRLREIEALRNLMAWQNYVNRVTADLLLLAGDDAFRMANTYYASVRSAAQSHLPGAPALYQLLRLFWNRPRRTSSSGEPTERELLRDARSVLHGNKDGFVGVLHESPTVSGGVHEVIDDVR